MHQMFFLHAFLCASRINRTWLWSYWLCLCIEYMSKLSFMHFPGTDIISCGDSSTNVKSLCTATEPAKTKIIADSVNTCFTSGHNLCFCNLFLSHYKHVYTLYLVVKWFTSISVDNCWSVVLIICCSHIFEAVSFSALLLCLQQHLNPCVLLSKSSRTFPPETPTKLVHEHADIHLFPQTPLESSCFIEK